MVRSSMINKLEIRLNREIIMKRRDLVQCLYCYRLKYHLFLCNYNKKTSITKMLANSIGTCLYYLVS